MKKRDRLRQEAHARSQQACADNRTLFEATPGGKKAVATLDTSVTDVDGRFAERQRCLENERAAAEACRTWRRAVRGGLTTVVNISAFVVLDEGTAKVMHPPTDASDELLVADTRAILDKVTPHADAFLAQGLPPNVLTDLPAQIAGLAAAKLALSAARQQRVAAGKAIRIALDAGDEAIKQLHTILVGSPSVDPIAVTRFRLAKRVGPRNRNEAPAAPAPAPVPAPSGTTKVA